MSSLLFMSAILGTLSSSALAETMSFQLEMGGEAIVKTETSGELYNFSPEFLEAVKNCSPYQENFTKTNPKRKYVPFFGEVDLDVNIDIKGLVGENCLFDIDYNMIGAAKINYNCVLSHEQLEEVYAAMTDKSGEVVEETYTSYMAYGIEGQPLTKGAPQTTTIKGTRFDIWATKIREQYCVEKYNEPTQEEQDNMMQKSMVLSDDFRKSLLTCNPAKDSKDIMMMSMNAEIVGKDNDNCHIKYDSFDLYIPLIKLSDIVSWMDLMNLSDDKTIRKYNPQYLTKGAMLALVGCQRDSSSGGLSSKMNKVERGFKGEYQDGKCTLSFIDKLIDDDNVEDYSKICVVDKGIIGEILRPYETLIQKYYGSYPYEYTHNKETMLADNEIFDLLVKSGACGTEM